MTTETEQQTKQDEQIEYLMKVARDVLRDENSEAKLIAENKLEIEQKIKSRENYLNNLSNKPFEISDKQLITLNKALINRKAEKYHSLQLTSLKSVLNNLPYSYKKFQKASETPEGLLSLLCKKDELFIFKERINYINNYIKKFIQTDFLKKNICFEKENKYSIDVKNMLNFSLYPKFYKLYFNQAFGVIIKEYFEIDDFSGDFPENVELSLSLDKRKIAKALKKFVGLLIEHFDRYKSFGWGYNSDERNQMYLLYCQLDNIELGVDKIREYG